MGDRTIDMEKVYAWKGRLNTWNGWTLPALLELINGISGKLKDWDEPEGIVVLASCTMMLGRHGISLWLPKDENVVNAWEAGSTSITILEDTRGYVLEGAETYPEHKFDPKTKEGYEDPVVKKFFEFIAGCSDEFYRQYMLVGRDKPTTTSYHS